MVEAFGVRENHFSILLKIWDFEGIELILKNLSLHFLKTRSSSDGPQFSMCLLVIQFKYEIVSDQKLITYLLI